MIEGDSTVESAFVKQLVLWNDLWFANVSHHRQDFLKPGWEKFNNLNNNVLEGNKDISFPNDAPTHLPTPALMLKLILLLQSEKN